MTQRKKILILTCTGGGGHIAATSALIEHFNTTYEIQIAYPLKTFLSPISFLSKIAPGYSDGERMYNYCIRKGYSNLLNAIARLGCWYFCTRSKWATKRMQNFLQESRPDLVISVIPLINGATLEACKELNIPFICAPTDLNTMLFLCNIKKPAYDKFFFTLPFEDQNTRAILQPACIPEYQIIVTGFLIRPGFFTSRSLEQKRKIKQTFGVPENKPVLMLLMGAQGSMNILTYVRQLAHIKTPVHLLIAIGKSGELKKQIEAIAFPVQITCTIIGYTDRMPDLMEITDFLITKAGSISIAEGIYSGIPMVIDTTNSVLAWEQLNVDFVREHGLGKCITRLDDVAPLVDELLGNKTEYDAIKKRILGLPKKNGLDEITKLVERLLEK